MNKEKGLAFTDRQKIENSLHQPIFMGRMHHATSIVLTHPHFLRLSNVRKFNSNSVSLPRTATLPNRLPRG